MIAFAGSLDSFSRQIPTRTSQSSCPVPCDFWTIDFGRDHVCDHDIDMVEDRGCQAARRQRAGQPVCQCTTVPACRHAATPANQPVAQHACHQATVSQNGQISCYNQFPFPLQSSRPRRQPCLCVGGLDGGYTTSQPAEQPGGQRVSQPGPRDASPDVPAHLLEAGSKVPS